MINQGNNVTCLIVNIQQNSCTSAIFNCAIDPLLYVSIRLIYFNKIAYCNYQVDATGYKLNIKKFTI